MSKRKVFYDDDDFTIKWEKLNEQLFVHVELRSVTKPIMGKIVEVWTAFQAQAYFEGYEDIYTYTQDPRIVKLVGGAIELKNEKLEATPDWRMFKWELK
jgi:hypothetical protein